MYPAKNVGGTDFMELPGRKTPIMISADDSSATVFAPYSNSYFPIVVLEVSPKGKFQFAYDLMRPRLPGMPPPVCARARGHGQPVAQGALRRVRRRQAQDPDDRDPGEAARDQELALGRQGQVGRLLRHRACSPPSPRR